MSDDNKVLGIPVNKYTKVCYILILVSGVFGVVTSLLALVGMYVGFGGVFGLLGLIGFGLAVTALFAFSEDFGDLDGAHHKCIAILFVAFFIFNMIIFNAVASFGAVGSIIRFLGTSVEVAILFAAYQTFEKGQMPTVETVKKHFFDLKKYVMKSNSSEPSKPSEPSE